MRQAQEQQKNQIFYLEKSNQVHSVALLLLFPVFQSNPYANYIPGMKNNDLALIDIAIVKKADTRKASPCENLYRGVTQRLTGRP